jgi:hypothetical protein
MKDTFKITAVTSGSDINENTASRCRKNKIPATGIAVVQQIGIE